MDKTPTISVAFRFHINFYHSYRGDTPDELGFGKDIRIIRHIITTLDHFNREGIGVCGTWDCENYFSLEKIMPEHCPDIIDALKRRVDQGRDEIQIMSYNNGLVSAHTAREFEDTISRAITNEAGSGVRDIFGRFGEMVRPQEMMMTPIHLKFYPACGVNSISLFYSALPFNAFSNFIPPLSFAEQYNPLTLTYPGIEETMTLMPAYNTGDLADNITLKLWIKRIRRKQLAMADPMDLLLLIDMDADDEFWFGYDVPVVKKFLSSVKGLKGLVDDVRDLDYVVFTTPCRYLRTHPPVGSISIGQDTADGSFDGMSSWAEKWSNHQLWTGVERSRILELQTRRLMQLTESNRIDKQVEALLSRSYEERLRSLSTTHFGLSAPIMNRTRLKKGGEIIASSVSGAARAFDLLSQALLGPQALLAPRTQPAVETDFTLMDYTRGVDTNLAAYGSYPSKALVKMSLNAIESGTVSAVLRGDDSREVPCALRIQEQKGGARTADIYFVEDMQPLEQKGYRLTLGKLPGADGPVDGSVSVSEKKMENASLSLQFDEAGQIARFDFSGRTAGREKFLNSGVTYSGKRYEVRKWEALESQVLGHGLMGIKRMRAEVDIKSGQNGRVMVEREFILAAGLPYLYVTLQVTYPETASQKFNKKRARTLEQEWDGRWREVMPCEISPALEGREDHPLRIWKHNYAGHLSRYDVNYADFSKNRELDSFNNHVTNGWVAVTDGDRGMLVAQTADELCSFAFCPMRTRRMNRKTGITLNPFGSYHGRQFKYGTAYTGIGKIAAMVVSDNMDPLAPSYRGRQQQFSLLIAPYDGNKPPEAVRNDAQAFSYPYLVLSRQDLFKAPGHRAWAPPLM